MLITDDVINLLRNLSSLVNCEGINVIIFLETLMTVSSSHSFCSADVKSETDICCTSSNAVEIVESLGVDKVIFLPDEYLAQNVAAQTKVGIISYKGTCIVHERFTPEEIREYRKNYPGIVVLAHPECPPDVVAEADYTGSTSKMTPLKSKYLCFTICPISNFALFIC